MEKLWKLSQRKGNTVTTKSGKQNRSGWNQWRTAILSVLVFFLHLPEFFSVSTTYTYNTTWNLLLLSVLFIMKYCDKLWFQDFLRCAENKRSARAWRAARFIRETVRGQNVHSLCTVYIWTVSTSSELDMWVDETNIWCLSYMPFQNNELIKLVFVS